ncbi:MAG: DNA repair protein RecN [Clostridiales bacterium]|nr:DNA repair protein RecN [Clostridiales bacterium]
MLEHLHIENIALIKSLDLDLPDGFNVLTGETGAGKSIIIDSIGLVIGERASKELIKSGEEKARVEASFCIDKNEEAKAFLISMDIESDDHIIVSRELSASGKSTCRIEGVPVGISVLKEFTSYLIDIHGQHEHQSLLSPAKHIMYLDAFAGDDIFTYKNKTALLASEYKAAKEKLDSEFLPEDERMRRIDILKFQVNEIDSLKLEDGEEERLEDEQKLLSNSEAIMSGFTVAHDLISDRDDSVLDTLNFAIRELDRIAGLSPVYDEVINKLREAYYALQDVSYTVRDIRDDLDSDPMRLDYIGSRLYAINGLKRKYGKNIAEILAFRDKASAELDMLMSADEQRDELIVRISKLKEEYFESASELSERRKRSAERIEKAVVEILKELGMKNASFEVRFGKSESISPSGIDKIEFYISTNKGETPKALSKVVSGGEMSRIMLALKTITADADSIDTMVFDEIDTGISGRVSMAVGENMAITARNKQILCITHSPQIAACASNHFVVEKMETQDSTVTTARMLSIEERPKVIASIMSGEGDSKLAIQHASELINQCAARIKEALE